MVVMIVLYLEVVVKIAYQVIKVLEHGLKVLCINSRSCSLTPLGRENLDNIGNSKDKF